MDALRPAELLKAITKVSSLKPLPNDRNMPTQHIATLLGATCCDVLRHVGCCWLKFETGQI